jgi:hypothetical protein
MTTRNQRRLKRLVRWVYAYSVYWCLACFIASIALVLLGKILGVHGLGIAAGIGIAICFAMALADVAARRIIHRR